MARERHIPVMAAEVVAGLAPSDGEVFIDGTFGGGGYARALLEAARVTVYGIDRDPEAIRRGATMAAEFPGRLHLIEGCFSAMDRLVAAGSVEAVDGVALDLGVSSSQIDTAARGFSFQADGPLDMRMGADGPTAADIVNETGESELADILWRYGEERQSRRIARAIVVARSEAPITRTLQLADIIARAAGAKARAARIHPATRSFQALRIVVNNELDELAHGLSAAERVLKPGGRLAVVAFHSLEDRIVKRFLAARAGRDRTPSRHRPLPADAGPAPSFRLIRTGAIKPGEAECAGNPRARSARLRLAERTAGAAWEAAA